ncbi:MAG TPA: biosynthetic peptidoglycan transglycosylase [Candidatus Polarisedimenticolaceae bacterium]|nr:biosynthetic peptidoglycan transglycosylase [Candidatus Polarisedimenticolaceae bacterium]
MPAARAKKRRGPLRRAFRIFVLVGLVLAAGYAAWEAATWPNVAALRHGWPRSTAFIEAWKRTHGGEPAWRMVPYARISPHLKRAVLVAEDIGFFSHDGFDLHEVRLAVRQAVDSGDAPRGASTLTQQLAKNLWLSPSRNPVRKLEEAILTTQLEGNLGKRRILELYLNVVEFGPGVFGAEAAARRFYGKGASALTEHEAAELAAGLPRSTWHPGVQSRSYHRYVSRIETRMGKAVFLWKQI